MTAPRAIASLAAVVAVAVLLAPSTASADPATAEALFREGRRLLDDGKTEEACSKLAESQAQDPSSGTLLNLGWCHEIQHKLATAWSDYVSAARLAREQGRPDRAAVADKKAIDLEPRLPHLTVTAIAPAAGMQIERGDARLGLGLLGSAVPLDPGSYVITARAPGHRPWKTTIDVAEAESKTVQVPELEAEAPPVAEAPETPLGPPAIAVLPPDGALTAAPPSTSHGHTFGWIIGGVGVAGVAVGAVAGIASLMSYHDASTLCPLRSGCSDAAMSARNSAESKAWVSNIAFGVGVVGVGIGSFILLSGRHAGPAAGIAVRAAPDATGMRVSLEQSF
jgi:tetratricopeptide (TPR) repeat protein